MMQAETYVTSLIPTLKFRRISGNMFSVQLETTATVQVRNADSLNEGSGSAAREERTDQGTFKQ